MSDVHVTWVQKSLTNTDTWEKFYTLTPTDDGHTIGTLTLPDGTPLRRGRDEKWEMKIPPGENVKLWIHRLVKRQIMAEEPERPLSGPPRLMNPKWSAPC